MGKLFKKLNEQLEINKIKESLVVTEDDESRLIFSDNDFYNILDEDARSNFLSRYRRGSAEVSKPIWYKSEPEKTNKSEDKKAKEENKNQVEYDFGISKEIAKLKDIVEMFNRKLKNLKSKYPNGSPEFMTVYSDISKEYNEGVHSVKKDVADYNALDKFSGCKKKFFSNSDFQDILDMKEDK